ncbi:AraC family transcriptional regulator [Paenibacillus sp. R14(2021)]|uniref:AraC family transcriptional regulator n=1 Tax=Paenibacillus sp. R14(2021) TaxID=2859228 RepID=UPI001C6154B6|nr:AraC family transcriptional regulator [Paenibacillus sp. R14(2021)]
MRKTDGFQSEKIIVLPPYLLEQMTAHPLIRPLYLTDIGYFPSALHHYRERPEGCDTHIVIYCAGGAGWVSVHGVVHQLQERSLIVIPADAPHAYGAGDKDPWTIYWFHFRGEQAAAYASLLGGGQHPLMLTTSDSDRFVTLFHQCYDLLSTKSYSAAHQLLAVQTAAYAMSQLGLISAERGDEDRRKPYVEAALQFMTVRLEHDLTLDEIARHAQISKQHLNHLFKASTGFAPIDYYHRMKMQRASQLLDLTSLSIKEICLSLGYKDPYYFSRLFKKMMGLSPTAYRSKLKG